MTRNRVVPPGAHARPDPLLLRPSTVARLLSLSPKVIRRMCAAGEIPTRRLGGRTMVPRVEFESWLQQLPGTSASEALRNLAQRALIAGLRAERVEVE